MPPKRAAARRAAAQPLHLAPVFDPAAQMDEDETEAVNNQIFSAVNASATTDWDVPAHGIGTTPVLNVAPVGTNEYLFEPVINRRWQWLSQHASLFYQAPDQTPYYLRLRNEDLGVSDREWRQYFPPGLWPALQALPAFRTSELINVDNLRRLNPRHHADRTVYYEIDLASRAPGHSINLDLDPAEVDQNNLGPLVNTILGQIDDRIRRPVNFAAGHLQDPQVASFAVTMAYMAYRVLGDTLLNNVNRQARLVMTYEVHSQQQNEVILLSRGIDFPQPLMGQPFDFRDRISDLALRLLQLMVDIAESLMVEHYEENGVHIFHPRTLRIVMAHMPGFGGQVFTEPPDDLTVPRGGCMSVTGAPKSLLVLLKDRVASHDIFKEGNFFDNNCGIREALLQLDPELFKPKNERGIKEFYMRAALCRAEAPNIPPFVKLTPLQVLRVLQHQFGDIYFSVWELPTPDHPAVRHHRSENPLLEPQWGAVNLVYTHGHYFGLHHEDDPTLIDEIASIRYCRRCTRYVMPNQGERKSHDFEDDHPNIMYPKCKARSAVRVTRIGGQPDDAVVIAPEERILKTQLATPFYMRTPNSHIGFMDLETYRPRDMGDYHEVYAVGWIPHCLEGAELHPKNVRLYDSTDDPLTHNAALVHAMVDLIALIQSKPDAYTPKKPYYLYFYNGAGFDNLLLLQTMASHFRALPTSMAKKDGRLMTLSFLDGALVVRDLCLFTLASLDKVCKTYNVDAHLAKGKFDHNLITSLEDVNQHWDKISDYLAKDLTALNAVFNVFAQSCFDIFKLDVCPRITMSHLAYDYWNTTLTESQRKKVTLPAEFDLYQDFLKAYYGGRVFPQIKEWISKHPDARYEDLLDYLIDLDVVSLYPTAMWFSEAISRLPAFETYRRNIPLYFCGTPTLVTSGSDFDQIWRLMTRFLVGIRNGSKASMDYWRFVSQNNAFNLLERGAIVCVDYEPNNRLVFPLLPHKDDQGNTAWDLKAHTKQWYVLEEILDAVFYGYRVRKLHAAYIFPHREALFDKAMKTLMEGKAACVRGDPKRDVYKLGANSIYGKHAQKALVEEEKLVYPTDLDSTMQSEFVLSIEPIVGEDHVGFLREMRHNKPEWINNDPDLVDRLEDLLQGEHDIPVQAFVVKTKPSNTLPSKPTYLGAQVTAYARIHMNWFLHTMKLLESVDIKHTVFYTDTDSLIVHRDATLGHGELFGDELGKLADELEGGRIVDYSALAPKTYGMAARYPDESLVLKMRAKGFPHTKEKLLYDKTPLVIWERPRPRYFPDSDWYPDGPYEDNFPTFDPTQLDLKRQIYVVERVDDPSPDYYTHLNPDIFRMVLHNPYECSVTVHFTSMRRNWFGAHSLGHVSGIRHCHLHRALTAPVWWDGTPDNPAPHRRESLLCPGITLPVGHLLLHE